MMANIKKKLIRQFKMKVLEQSKQFLGIRISRDNGIIKRSILMREVKEI